MSEPTKPEVGSVNWFDLTVPNADRVRDFYAEVAGWRPEPVEMDGYSDYSMNLPGSGRTVTGICHARGANAKLPPQWLLYITVVSLDHSLRKCVERGGAIIESAREMGDMGRMCGIRPGRCAPCSNRRAARFEPGSTARRVFRR